MPFSSPSAAGGGDLCVRALLSGQDPRGAGGPLVLGGWWRGDLVGAAMSSICVRL